MHKLYLSIIAGLLVMYFASFKLHRGYIFEPKLPVLEVVTPRDITLGDRLCSDNGGLKGVELFNTKAEITTVFKRAMCNDGASRPLPLPKQTSQ